ALDGRPHPSHFDSLCDKVNQAYLFQDFRLSSGDAKAGRRNASIALLKLSVERERRGTLRKRHVFFAKQSDRIAPYQNRAPADPAGVEYLKQTEQRGVVVDQFSCRSSVSGGC